MAVVLTVAARMETTPAVFGILNILNAVSTSGHSDKITRLLVL
jgi:hypothetical protein